MGCQLAKCVESGAIDYNDDKAFHALNKPPPPADPRSPLTTKQQYNMLASWKGIYRQIEQTGIIFFIKLFEENEDLMDLFQKFEKLKSKEDKFNSEELAEHASKVMHTLDESIKKLGEMDNFLHYVQHVGATHHQVPGFKAENFWKVEQPFLEAAKMTLGDRYTANVENIYKLTIKFILENLVKGFEESTDQENGTAQSIENQNTET